mgnify:CR=1 FL=1
MLRVIGLTKEYSSTLACDHVDLSLKEGETGVLLGPNGAGKSTVIKCIMGLLRYEGSIEVDGHSNKLESAKRIMGYVPEIPALYELMTVEEHAEFICRAYRLDTCVREYADELMTRLELQDVRKKLGKELSKGMQQKVSIMCALLPRPKMVLLDEPLVGLDPHAIKVLKNLFVELKANKTAVLVSTHMIDSVSDIWDRSFIMVKGRIAKTCTKEEIAAKGESLEKLFFSVTEDPA